MQSVMIRSVLDVRWLESLQQPETEDHGGIVPSKRARMWKGVCANGEEAALAAKAVLT